MSHTSNVEGMGLTLCVFLAQLTDVRSRSNRLLFGLTCVNLQHKMHQDNHTAITFLSSLILAFGIFFAHINPAFYLWDSGAQERLNRNPV